MSDTTLEEITALVEGEMANWNALGLSLDQITPANEQIFTMSTRLECLCYFLVEEQRLPNEDEFNTKLNEIILGYLINIREKVEPQIQRMRAMEAGMAVPDKPQIVDQFGQKLGPL